MKSIVTAIALGIFALTATPVLQAKSTEEGKAAAKQDAPKVFTSPQSEGTKATCPVMGGAFTIGKNTQHSEYKGKHVYFCCAGCKKDFDKDPEKYLK
jgi:YHS domain-containing protein